MTKKSSNQRQLITPNREEAKQAFDRSRADRERLRPEEVAHPKVDLARAAGIVLAALPKITELASEMEQLHDFDPKLVEGLRDLALGALYAQAITGSRRTRGPGIRKLIDEAKSLRRTLMVQTEQLTTAWKMLDPGSIEVGTARRNTDLAQDLIALAALLRSRWEVVQDKTPLTIRDLDRADELGTRLLHALGAGGMDARARAFTLLVRSYDQVRRAVAYLRWNEGDADAIAPTIYAARAIECGSRGVTSGEICPTERLHG